MSTKRYWKSYEDLENDPQFLKEQFENNGKDVPVDELVQNALPSNRRDFLKIFGFGVGAVALAACNNPPVKYALPYVNAPSDLQPGVPNYYATSFDDGQDFVPVLVKTREGRPIHIEPNPEAPLGGGVGARAHASVLGLYDNKRLRGPKSDNGAETWENIDRELPARLKAATANGQQIAILTGSVHSPMTRKAIADFAAAYSNVRHVQYDAVSFAGIRQAHNSAFGKAAIPAMHFNKAKVIVGVNADFLGTWLLPTHFTKQYAQTRKLTDETGKATMSRHYQFETSMSITGSNADYRAAIKPSQEGQLLLNLYNKIASATGAATYQAPALDFAGNVVDRCAQDLLAAKGESIVVSGSNDPNIQMVVAAINSILGNYGTTLDIDSACMLRQGNDAGVVKLVADMEAGRVGALLIHGCNPAYSLPNADAFISSLGKVQLKVSFGNHEDETGSLMNFMLPHGHYLENWGAAQTHQGHYTLQQPTISPIFNTRQLEVSLAKWVANNPTAQIDAYSYLKNTWRETVYAEMGQGQNFEDFWKRCLHDGFVSKPASTPAAPTMNATTLGAAANAAARSNASGMEVLFYQKVGLGDGAQAGNPWLLELPDPITKVSWDNYCCMSRFDADQMGLTNEDVVKITLSGKSVELPVYIMPGQARGTVAVAMGYGRDKIGAMSQIGQNVFPMVPVQNGTMRYTASGVSLEATGATYELAMTQTHDTIMGRPIVKETVLSDFLKNPAAGNEGKTHIVQLYPDYTKNNTGHHWAMVVDMNACTGCGSCVIACQSENNIPVVGKKEVRNRREMHWIRIDRYFAAEAGVGAKLLPNDEQFATINEENPQVVHQPMMCQQCDNAPCETVCPVLATTHSEEGINQMTYNRCVGTRYCANNCPYKVRRFNWFDYANQDSRGRERGNLTADDILSGTDYRKYNPSDALGRMVLNPDVTVRSRGVMEKCTFCVQRLQAAKLAAKVEQRGLNEDQIQPACASSCPAGAIVLGDVNDPNSRVSKLLKSQRGYKVLEDVKTLPSVTYLTKVRNIEPEAETTA